MVPGSARNWIAVKQSNLNEKMKQKTLIYVVTKPLIVLAAAIRVAASFLVSAGAATDPTYLMPTGPGGGQPDDGKQPFDPSPATPGSKTRQFLTYGFDATATPSPKDPAHHE